MPRSEDWRLKREERFSDAVLREFSEDSQSTSIGFEYESDDHFWRGSWDGREDGDTFYAYFGEWDEPEEEPMSDAQRNVLVERLAKFAPGGLAITEQVDGKPVVRATGAKAFVIQIDGDYEGITYWEKDHRLELKCHDGGELLVVVDLPAGDPVWNYPEGLSITAGPWARILGNIVETHGAERLDKFGTRIVVPGVGTSPGY